MNRDGTNPVDETVNEMAAEFIAEIKDDLAGLEPDLLAMENMAGQVDAELVNHAFRTIHSIKGGAGFIRFDTLSDLAHAMENVLMQIREEKQAITTDIVDALLAGFDKMKLLVEGMDAGTVSDIRAEVAALETALDHTDIDKTEPPEATDAPETADAPDASDGAGIGDPPKPEPAHSPEPAQPSEPEAPEEPAREPDPASATDGLCRLKPAEKNARFKDMVFTLDEQAVSGAVGAQQFLYGARIPLTGAERGPELVQAIDQIGRLLTPGPDASAASAAAAVASGDGPVQEWACVIATILDKALLAQVLEVETDRIVLLDRQFVPLDTLLRSSALSVQEGDASDRKGAAANRKGAASDQKGAPSEPPVTVADVRSKNQSLRISVDLISRLMNRAGELVLCRNQLRPFMEKLGQENGEAAFGMQNLDMVTADIQEAIMQMRMKPVSDLLEKYRRVIRDMARRLSKKVNFTLEGGNVEVDGNILEQLANPMTHLIRNCIDHGIESPEARRAKGKHEAGQLFIRVYHQGGNVHMDIRDDGAGIDPDAILEKALEKGLVDEGYAEGRSDKEKLKLVFLPGFSTSDIITDMSGRGVGMDVVRTRVQRLRGHIEIDSEKDRGTTVRLTIPLTLAIVPSLIVGEGGELFAIPQVNIKEVIYLTPGELGNRVECIAGNEVLRLREHLLPILRLRNVLDITTYVRPNGSGEIREERRKRIADRRRPRPEKTSAESESGIDKRFQKPDRRKEEWDAGYVIVLKLGTHLFGILVEQLYDIEEVVVEPLSEYLKDLKWFAGATILGDGRVIMVLDVPGIAAGCALTFDSIKHEESRRQQARKKTEAKGERRNLMVFENSPGEFFALDLTAVSRLEPVNPDDIHRTGNLTYTEFASQAALLFSMDMFLPASPCPIDTADLFTIFLKQMDSPVGILATAIVDTLQTRETIRPDASCPDTVAGKLFLDGMMIQVLDGDRFSRSIREKVVAVKGLT